MSRNRAQDPGGGVLVLGLLKLLWPPCLHDSPGQGLGILFLFCTQIYYRNLLNINELKLQ